jgi:ubiquinone/menaquinone biosynthesis C-methylase UbiE
MATVFMKWLETRPEVYDRGIRLLTLGRLAKLHEELVSRFVSPGMTILEIGCGTGTLTRSAAEAGAHIMAIDRAPAMLAIAEDRLSETELGDRVSLKLMDASLIGDRYDPESFDLVISSLALSEMTAHSRSFMLAEISGLLKPGGKIAIIDETIPEGLLKRVAYGLLRFPLRVLTWLLTRTTTHPLKAFPDELVRSGYSSECAASSLGGALQLWVAEPLHEEDGSVDAGLEIEQLTHRRTMRTSLLDIWSLFFRIVPPYPKFTPGLYKIGQPDDNSPILVTGNYELTVRRLVKAIDGALDAWLLVADSNGINVWCSAGGGFFTAERIIEAVRTSGVDRFVKHRALILPQLCANGVDGWRIREETGWGVHWGPVYARDIPAYLEANRKKKDAVRWVSFPLKDRLEMLSVTLAFYGLLIMIPVAIFWRDGFWAVMMALVGLGLFYAITLPWLPGRDGLQKSIPLTIIALLGTLIYTALVDPVPPADVFNRILGITALSVFTAAELQGMSPLMRGEQANWIPEALVGSVLLASYFLVPILVGWT